MVFLKLPQWFDLVLRVLIYFWYRKGGNLFETRFLHVLLSWEATKQMFKVKLQHGTFKAGRGCLFKRGCLSEGGRYIELLYSWRFSLYSVPIHWLVHGHMTSNNENFSPQMPWAGNIAKTMTSNGKQFTVTREMLTAVARDDWNLSAVFKFCFCFVLLYNKSLNDWSLGEKWILFSSNLNVSLDFVSGNIEILGKQSSLFPSGPVIKCLLLST